MHLNPWKITVNNLNFSKVAWVLQPATLLKIALSHKIFKGGQPHISEVEFLKTSQ